MPAEITVVAGPAGAGKTARFVAAVWSELAASRREGKLGTALWLTPSFRAADGVRQRLLGHDEPAVLGLGIRTFDQFAEALLGGAITSGRPIAQLQKRQLLGQVLGELLAGDELRFFQELADRPSLVETLGRTITELKRRGITPAMLAKRAARRGASPRDKELARIYAAYQQRLDAHRLYDVDSRLALASGQVRRGELGAYSDLRLLVVDEFTTFTPAQLELLQAWAERGARIMISLPLDGGAERPELFATTRATLEELRSKFAKLQVEKLNGKTPSPWWGGLGSGDDVRTGGTPPLTPPHQGEGNSGAPPHQVEGKRGAALSYLERHLFINPRVLQQADRPHPNPPPQGEGIGAPSQGEGTGTPSPRGGGSGWGRTLARGEGSCADGIEIIAAASEQDEVLQVARRVKRLLATGVPARDILVTARTFGAVGPRIREVFPRFGIPVAVEGLRPLGEEPLVRALVALLELDESDWAFRKLVRLVTNRRVTAFDRSGGRGAAEWIVREVQIASGRDALLKAVSKLATPKENETTEAAKRRQMASAAATTLQELAAALDELLTRATPLEWFTALAKLAERLGIEGEYADSMTVLRQALRSVEQLAAWQGQPAEAFDRREALKLLRDIASHEALPERIDDTGRVRVIGAPTARLLDAKHLFVMGMVEQSFPPPEPVGELLGDRELDALAGVWQVDDNRPEAGSSEMLLFYELVSRASESLVFSYAALDDKAQTQFASPYLQDVERLFGPGAIPRTRPEDHLRPVPAGAPTSDADWRLAAVDRALAGSPALLAGLVSEARTGATARAIVSGLEVTHHRTRGESFGPFEGVFPQGPAHRRLAKHFGGEHLWSPSQLERYAECPFRFLMEHVCGFEPPGELLLATDPQRKGILAHEALALLHRRLRERVEEPHTVSHLGAETLQAEYLAALEEARKQRPDEGVAGALADLEMADIALCAAAYAKQHDAYDKKWKELEQPLVPRHFEVRFGPARGSTDGEDEHSTDEPFVLQVGDEELRFTGRIDRIDVGRMHGQTVISIVDYKTGSTVRYQTNDVESGKQLQLVLYALAAEQHLFRGENAIALQAGYWKLPDDKLEGREVKRWVNFQELVEGRFVTSQAWSQTWEKTQAGVAGLVRGIRQGQFPMVNTDEHCTSSCGFKTVCRVGVARSLEKQWPPEEQGATDETRIEHG